MENAELVTEPLALEIYQKSQLIPVLIVPYAPYIERRIDLLQTR